MQNRLTVIISFHAADNPTWFVQAAESVLSQTLSPEFMIITVDGQIPEGHELAIEHIRRQVRGTQISELRADTQDRGRILGMAVESASTNFIAIMDADDISHQQRFEKQAALLSGNPDIGVVGSSIKEISPTDSSYSCFRKVPLDVCEVREYAKLRNPVNNMSVMFRREIILAAGNYRSMPNFADYWLWVRVLHNGDFIANIDEPLVVARAGEGLARRRRGLKYVKDEFRFIRACHKLGFLSITECCRNAIIRLPVRFLPERAFNFVLRKFLRS